MNVIVSGYDQPEVTQDEVDNAAVQKILYVSKPFRQLKDSFVL